MLGSKGSSINLSRQSITKRTSTEGGRADGKSQGRSVRGPPKVNASNNTNGDEHFKIHTAHGGFKCPVHDGNETCVACRFQVTEQAKNALKEHVSPVELYIRRDCGQTIEKEQFPWLMEHLLPPNPAKFKGCELIFPDTAIFEQGVCKSVIKNDEEYCLIQMKNPQKLGLIAVQSQFLTVIRERRNDQNGVFSQIYHKNFQL